MQEAGDNVRFCAGKGGKRGKMDKKFKEFMGLF